MSDVGSVARGLWYPALAVAYPPEDEMIAE